MIIERDGKRYVEHNGQLVPILYEAQEGPQTWAERCDADYILYGGARGGGKSHWLMAEATRYGHIEGYQGLILRRTHKRLAELKRRAQKLWPPLGWEQSTNDFIHKETGALVRFGHCQYEKDADNYLSHEYQRIYYDQLEEFTEKMFDDINTTCRSVIPQIKSQVLCTANPGGIGHYWVKRAFVDKCPPLPNGPKQYAEEYKIWWQPESPGETYVDEDGLSFKYIPSKVFENKYLASDKAYVLRLKKLPEQKMKGHLHGSWDVFIGQFFEEWDEKIHVQSKIVPKTWRRYISLDYGSSQAFVAMFHAVDSQAEDIYTYKEYWAKGKHLKYHAYQIALKMKDEPHIEKIIYPHDMQKRQGKEEEDFEPLWESFKTYLSEALEELGVTMRLSFTQAVAGPNSRIMGWDMMKTALSVPWWYITPECKMLRETLPYLIHDDNNPDDVDSESKIDHWAEASRHGIVHIKRDKPNKLQKGDAYTKERVEHPQLQDHWMTW